MIIMSFEMCSYSKEKNFKTNDFRFLLSANWLHLLGPLQRDAIANKVYRSLTDTTGKIVQNNSPIRLTTTDPSTLDMVARTMPSLSTRQIINAIGDKIVNIFFCVSKIFYV